MERIPLRLFFFILALTLSPLVRRGFYSSRRYNESPPGSVATAWHGLGETLFRPPWPGGGSTAWKAAARSAARPGGRKPNPVHPDGTVPEPWRPRAPSVSLRRPPARLAAPGD